MKRILLSILVIGIFLLSACGAPTTIPPEGSEPTPQPYTTQPVIQQLPVSDITETSAVISWLTDRPTFSKVIYGLTTSNEYFSITDNRLSSTHSFELKWLQPDTLYRYKVYSQDAHGNEATSSENIFRTKALPPDKGIIIGTVLYADGTPANNVFVYIFKDEESCSFAFCTTDKEGHYTFADLPFGHYEVYSSNMQLGLYEPCVEKDLYRSFIRPPETVNLTKNQLIIAPTRTHFKEIKMHYHKEYFNTNQPEISWDPVPTAAYYKVKIVDGYLNEGDHEDYEKEITVFDTSIVWPEQLTEMHYMVSVYAYDNNDMYLTDAYESFWIGPSAR